MTSEDRSSHLSGYEQEIREGKTIGAMALLEEKIIPDLHKDDPTYEIPKKLSNKLLAIQIRETHPDLDEPNAFNEYCWITYKTQTGEIGHPLENYEAGEYSRIAVTLKIKDETYGINEKTGFREKSRGKYEFQLFHPGFTPSSAEYSKAFLEDAGEYSSSETMPNRWIQPERLASEQSDSIGIHEIPGQSQFPVSTQGDFIIINALRRFNNKYSGRETNNQPQV